MQRMQGIFMTTRPLPDGTVFTLEDLENAAEQLKRHYIPMNVEHDIRRPPVGRIVAAEVVQIEEGIFALQGTTELFDGEDSFETLQGDGRTIPLSLEEIDTIKIEYDESFENEEDQRLIEELAEIAGSDENKQLMLKFSMEPVSVILITAGIFALGNIASGFLQKLGADAHDSIKKALKRHTKRKFLQEKSSDRESVIGLRFIAKRDQQLMEINLLLSNPTEEQVEVMFEKGLKQLDRMLENMPDHVAQLNPAQMIFEYRDGHPEFSYGVLREGVPFELEQKTEESENKSK